VEGAQRTADPTGQAWRQQADATPVLFFETDAQFSALGKAIAVALRINR
jgi:hypothetical protein